MMPSPAKESSPGKPQLSAVTDRPTSADSTGPSPMMPALSPYPLAGKSRPEDGEISERRKAAKKSLDFGSSPGTGDAVNDGLRSMEEESILEADDDGQGVRSEDTMAVSGSPTNNPPDTPPESPHTRDTSKDDQDVVRSTPPSQSSAMKRRRSVSPRGSDPKRPRQTSPSVSDIIPVESATSPDTRESEPDPEATKDWTVQQETIQITSPLSFPAAAAESDSSGQYVFQDAESEAEDPENLLHYHGINLFGNPAHRQELINFCEQSLAQSTINCTEPNYNSNNNISGGNNYHHNRTAHDQLDSVVQRARARGFLVSDAVYFDGKQYVPIKVASNGRGKFRLLLPPDHPHRRGVAEEIPIFKTFELDSSLEDAEEEENLVENI